MDSSLTRIKVAVVGAGVVGLSVAYRLVDDFEGDVEITVIAEAVFNQTTSFGAGGLWEPYKIGTTSSELINMWGEKSFKHFLSLYYGPDAASSGVQLTTAFELFEEGQDTTPPRWKDVVFNFTVLDPMDLRKMGLPDRFTTGFSFGTLVIDQKYYMQYLMKQLESLNVKFQQRKIVSLDEFQDSVYDVVVNCAGLGAAELVGDEEMYPIRGQVIRVNWGSSYIIPNRDTVPLFYSAAVNNMATSPRIIYKTNPFNPAIPTAEQVVLGGTAQNGDWSTTASIGDSKRILDDVCELFPSIREAPIESVWVGLRPGRTRLRLESAVVARAAGPTAIPTTDTANAGAELKKDLLVVHCYGHGGSGITLAMGCAEDVVANHIMPLWRLRKAESTEQKGF